jgi:hypothetical protein
VRSGWSHSSSTLGTSITGIRLWIGATTWFGVVVMMVQRVSSSPVDARQIADRPAKPNTSPSSRARRYLVLWPGLPLQRHAGKQHTRRRNASPIHVCLLVSYVRASQAALTADSHTFAQGIDLRT